MLLTHTETYIVRRLLNDTHTEYVVEKYNVHGRTTKQTTTRDKRVVLLAYTYIHIKNAKIGLGMLHIAEASRKYITSTKRG